MPFFKEDPASEARGLDARIYTLEDVASYLDIDHEKLKDNLAKEGKPCINDILASACVSSIVQNLSLDTIPQVVTNCEMEFIKNLPHLYASTTQRPDVIVYSHDKTRVATFIEVQSSPMVQTERKATLVAKDLLRALRCADPSLTKLSVFCFPKCRIKQCIIEIEVHWQSFHIVTKLTRFQEIKDGVNRLKLVIKTQLSHPQIQKTNDNIMTLSPEDLSTFGADFEQMPSPSHIIVTNKEIVVKPLYSTDEILSIMTLLNECNFPKIKKYSITPNPHHSPYSYSYQYVPYGPMNWTEGKSCLKELLTGIGRAIVELITLGIRHNDVSQVGQRVFR